MLIALSGSIGSGKSYVSDILLSKYGFIKYAFADPLKSALCKFFDWDLIDFLGDRKEKTDSRWGVSPRQMMQFFGTEVAQYYLPSTFSNFKEKVYRNIWVKHFENFYEYNNFRDVVVSDLRFPHEYESLKLHGAKFVRVMEEYKEISGYTHMSEKSSDGFVYDYVIDNTKKDRSVYSSIQSMLDVFGWK